MPYRVHDPPDAVKMEDFKELICTFGLALPGGGVTSPLALSDILGRIKGRPEERLINQVLLRSMKQAKYEAENRGHFGLASATYTHFTSPIRRYPDLIIHRLLKRVMKGRMAEDEKADWKQRLPEIARHASERERLSMEAEREVIQRKRVKFMVDKVEALYEGVVTGVAAYGLFVELKPFFVEGFLHISALPDDYYLYDEKRHLLIGEHQRKVFRLGDPIVIRVRSVDVENMKIDFELAPTGKKSVKRPSKN